MHVEKRIGDVPTEILLGGPDGGESRSKELSVSKDFRLFIDCWAIIFWRWQEAGVPVPARVRGLRSWLRFQGLSRWRGSRHAKGLKNPKERGTSDARGARQGWSLERALELGSGPRTSAGREEGREKSLHSPSQP